MIQTASVAVNIKKSVCNRLNAASGGDATWQSAKHDGWTDKRGGLSKQSLLGKLRMIASLRSLEYIFG